MIFKLRYDFARTTPPLELETTFDDNIRIITSLSDHIESQVFWQGFQEADEGVIVLLKRQLPKNGIFIDIGANIGTFTLVAARRALLGQVHAFEPSAHHFARLARNIELNHFGNVFLNQKGIYDQPGEATLFLPSQAGEMNNSGAASLYTCRTEEAEQVSEGVSLIRLDDYIRDRSVECVDIIKIDIEGAEIKALEGARETIMRFRPLVFMELDLDNLARAGQSPDEVLELWKSLNYEVSIILVTGKTIPVNNPNEFGPHQNLECRPR
ncbi:FkbM family methyltransferase [Nitrosospira sp. Nsp18]|uniref:FkbM family methyltransferase n=1 Tax=Nitrosospira sp. Nsp18 TaxID=1855334 RepID=UPI0015A1276B|nr:FkbM family methyltransferase [Nitrosospira sp. Nsp18]